MGVTWQLNSEDKFRQACKVASGSMSEAIEQIFHADNGHILFLFVSAHVVSGHLDTQFEPITDIIPLHRAVQSFFCTRNLYS